MYREEESGIFFITLPNSAVGESALKIWALRNKAGQSCLYK